MEQAYNYLATPTSSNLAHALLQLNKNDNESDKENAADTGNTKEV
jgi:hypothetical protein